MSMTAPENEAEPLYPYTYEERQAILLQMERILGSPHFSHSKRYPMLLRYIIKQTLDGHAANLKERTLGIEVFDRDAAYDTTNDPVVRISAGEVRKRIAQYYHDAGHEQELRIDLPAGSYIPRFTSHSTETVAASSDSEQTVVPRRDLAPLAEKVHSGGSRHISKLTFALLAVLVLIVAVSAGVYSFHREKGVDSVWRPFYTDMPVLLSMGDPSYVNQQPTQEPSVNDVTVRQHVRVVHFLVFSDVQAMNRVAELLAGGHHAYRLQLAADTTFQDLRQGPAVLLGGFDNPWTNRVLSGLRYRLGRDSTSGLFWIEDQKNPGDHRWAVDFSQRYATLNADYAIVARLIDPSTHQPVILLAGVGENGTKAASEMMTDPNSDAMRSLIKAGIRPVQDNNWNGQSFEIVIGTQVINGVSGPPKILAQVIW